MKNVIKIFKSLNVYQILTIPFFIAILLSVFDFSTDGCKVGLILPFNGKYSSRSQSFLEGFQLAADKANELKNPSSKKITILTGDSSEGRDSAAEAARDLIYKQGITVMAGGIHQKDTRAIQGLTEQAMIPFITGMCTHYEITENGADYTFRNITDDRLQFEALASYAQNHLKVKNLLVIFDDEIYGPDSALLYAEISAKYGQKVLSSLLCPSGKLNYKNIIENAVSCRTDAIVILASSYDSAMLVRHLRESGYEGSIIGGQAMASRDFLRIAGVTSENTITVLPVNNKAGGQISEDFNRAYYNEYGKLPDADAAMGYENMIVIALALHESKNDPMAIRDKMATFNGWSSIAGSGGFDSDGNQVRHSETAIIKNGLVIPTSMENYF